MPRVSTILPLAMAVLSIPALAWVAESAKPARADDGSRQVPVSVGLDAAECDFNRISLSPDGSAVIAWDDRKPNAVYPAGNAANSSIAYLEADGTKQFFRFPGEISALNWRSSGKYVEMLLEGRNYGLFEPAKSELRAWPLHPAWASTNVESARFDALREGIDKDGLVEDLARLEGPYSRFAGALVLAARDELFTPGQLMRRPVGDGSNASLFDLASPLAVAQGGMPSAREGLPVRPLFNLATGKIVGEQHLGAVRRAPDDVWRSDFTGGLVEDGVAVGGSAAFLIASASGGHFVRFEHESKPPVQYALCGSGTGNISSSITGFAMGGMQSAALFHRQAAGSRKLAVQFHGGPFSSVEDGYPSRTIRKLVGAGYDVLQMDGIGARTNAPIGDRPDVTAQSLGKLNAEVAAWVARQDYDDIVVVGESYGALAASDLAIRFNESGQDPVRLALLAPLTILHADRAMNGRKPHPASLQLRSEAKAFGVGQDRVRLGDWLEDLMMRACSLGEVVVVIGEADRRTPPDNQAPCIRKKAKIVPDANHVSLFDKDEAWQWLN
ncbi:alpha/beta fold hydrolase [Qipengyuania aquimaris]|uniref:alpha/beta fold hydrolase n=1 Tax=Qipengyuania aquimaris TaxID=255984 RepID=UPI001CD59457|nr:alpha/beta fold hydrolase [Qipengyuania aquimaris]MCA0903893.1 hypothetical protein [Qipengyuania aquimaris]